MRPRSIVVAVAALALLSVALWLLGRGSSSRERAVSKDQESPARAAATPSGWGGVPSRPSDLSAAARVFGVVVDEDGGLVTEGALQFACLHGDNVEAIPDASARLDEDGQFSAATCRTEVCATFHHPYLVPTEAWVLRAGIPQTLVARRLARLWGRVQTVTGEPAIAATVTFLPPADASDDPTSFVPLVSRATTTDADGSFSVAWIERPPCGPCERALDRCALEPLPLHTAVRVVVSASGLAPVTVEIDAENPPGRDADDPLVIALAGAADLLTGSLRDPGGEPYPRAYVLARSIERPHEQRRAEVIDGNFEVDGLQEGRYGLRAIQDGVELATGEAGPGEDAELQGQLRADGPSVVVTVVDEADRPVRSATVDGGPFRAAITDMQGQVRGTNALSGRFAIRVRGQGAWARQEVTVMESADSALPIAVRVRLGR